ncbi:MAG TPA: hypothetical protein VFA41_19265 [Ktedonobacteraceae bacterium]|jgi:hypothetical protein|nr:hypothetical protein [Ktedonobacteraceae bacterium]
MKHLHLTLASAPALLVSREAAAPLRPGSIEYPEVGHELWEKCWQQAREHMVRWFERFLKED